MPMKGMSLRSLKQHSSLAPLFLFLGAGAGGAAFYILRMAFRAPDVSWAKKKNPEHWNKLEPTYQFKFFSPTIDYSKLKADPTRPDFEYNVKDH